MPKLTWDEPENRFFEQGASHGVLYTPSAGVYSTGVAWNGLVTVTESPSGAEPNKQYADNIEYVNLTSREEWAGTIECFTFPDEFLLHDGVKKTANGLQVGMQNRPEFGFCWRSEKGTSEDNNLGYVLHMAYALKASPSERARSSVNDSPEAMTFSFGVWSTPISVPGFDKPVAVAHVDSTDDDVTPAGLAALEAALYGDATTPAHLPLPDAIDTLLATT